MKKFLAMLLTAAMLLSVGSAFAAEKQVIKYSIADDPQQMDPSQNTYSRSSFVLQNLFAGLYKLGPDGETYIPACAESYEVSEDGKTYTFKMKEGLKWSDGSALTAHDFEYTWKHTLNPDVASPTASDLWVLDNAKEYNNGECTADEVGVKAIDDLTLVVTTDYFAPWFPSLTATTAFFPVNKAVVEAEGEPWTKNVETYVSNGPFMLTEYSSLDKIVMSKNPNYHDAANVTIDKIEFMLSADDTAIYAAYNAGNVDFIDTVPTDEIAALLDNDEFYIVDNLGTYYVAFNVNSELFEGKTAEEAACMRLAFNILIDRDYIVENVGQTGQVAASSYIPLGMADGNGGVFKETAEDNSYYDALAKVNDPEGAVEQARTYLKAAGYKFDEDGMLSEENPIVIEYLTNDGTGHVAAAESMQQDFKEIGIEISIQQVEWNTFLQERKNGNFDIAREGWLADFDDPINMLEMFTTDSGNNDCQYGRYDGWDAE